MEGISFLVDHGFGGGKGYQISRPPRFIKANLWLMKIHATGKQQENWRLQPQKDKKKIGVELKPFELIFMTGFINFFIPNSIMLW